MSYINNPFITILQSCHERNETFMNAAVLNTVSFRQTFLTLFSLLLNMILLQMIFMRWYSLVEAGFTDDKCASILIFTAIVRFLHHCVHQISDSAPFYVLLLFHSYFQGHQSIFSTEFDVYKYPLFELLSWRATKRFLASLRPFFSCPTGFYSSFLDFCYKCKTWYVRKSNYSFFYFADSPFCFFKLPFLASLVHFALFWLSILCDYFCKGLST